MKVTVKPKTQKENQKVPFDEIPVGYVYVAKYTNGPIALKLNCGEAVLLRHYDDLPGSDFFEIAAGFKGEPAIKVLGKLTELIVEEE